MYSPKRFRQASLTQRGGKEDGWTGVKQTGSQEDKQMAGNDRRKAKRHTGGQKDSWTGIKQTGIQEEKKIAA
jgi:hypothetical protein